MICLTKYMESVNENLCIKCKKTKTIDNFKCCISCREYLREYHYKNREKLNENRKLNHLKNKDYDKIYWKEYQENHREEIRERKQNYIEKNKDKIKAKRQEYQNKTHVCHICNYEIKFYKKSQHEKSQTHQNNLKQQADKPLETQMHKLKPLIP